MEKEKSREEIEKEIDRQLEQSFPASDPPSYSMPGNDDIKKLSVLKFMSAPGYSTLLNRTKSSQLPQFFNRPLPPQSQSRLSVDVW